MYTAPVLALVRNQFTRNTKALLAGVVKKHIQNTPRFFTHTDITIEPMAEPAFSGKPLGEILEGLEKFAPLKYAESWDNVGLLVDPMEDSVIKSILLTNDLTEDVLDEAVGLRAGLIISYHPNIFQGLKSVSARTWKERLVVKAIKNKIAVFSPHTSWDTARGGVNDWLVHALPAKTISPIKPTDFDITIGAGRLSTLPCPMVLSEAITYIKKHVGIDYLRLALARGKTESSTISKVAFCAGSGSSVLRGQEADLYLTGEMLHHDILEATQNGIHVILCNHSDSERGFLKHFSGQLQSAICRGSVDVHVSKMDRDPLKTV